MRPVNDMEVIRRVKRLIVLAIAFGLVMLFVNPVMAVSLRVGPPKVEFDVPSSGSTEANFRIYDFSGDVDVELEDIPLSVKPEVVSVQDVQNGTPITLTFYGDESLGSQTFKGIIYFTSKVGTVGVRVGVRATVNHTVTSVITRVVASGATNVDMSAVIDETGVISEDITKVVPQGGQAKIEILQGSRALIAEGEALREISVQQLSEVPAPPHLVVVGPAYNLGPDGATFEPAMKLSVGYCTGCCKEAGVAEEDLLIACYDEKEGWVELESKVDTEKRVVFARVDHFSQFAVVAPAPPLINWLLIGEIIAVALAIGMGVYLIRRTKG